LKNLAAIWMSTPSPLFELHHFFGWSLRRRERKSNARWADSSVTLGS
jgi:hypothetical protein